MASFGERLETVFSAHGNLCVGIDPHTYLLSQWGLPDTAAGVREFALRVLDAVDNQVGIIKPQVAFFERHGAAGYAVLEEVIAAGRAAGVLVIADAKRGDVGTSVEAYGQAWLEAGSSLESDALTVSAFQGLGSLEAVLELAHAADKGLFVLAATSNPEAAILQRAVTADGATVAATISRESVEWNDRHRARAGSLGSLGLVLGATVALNDYGIDTAMLTGTPILAPGFGHQGALLEDIPKLYGGAASNVIVSASRSILSAGPHDIAAAVREQAAAVRSIA